MKRENKQTLKGGMIIAAILAAFFDFSMCIVFLIFWLIFNII